MTDQAIIARAHAPRVADVQVAVCRRLRLSRAQMLGDSRIRDLVRPRQIAMYLAARLSCRSDVEIGAQFNRDRSTVLHARRTIQRLRDEDHDLAELIADLARELEVTCGCARCVADRRRYAMDPPQLVLPIYSPSELLLEVAA